MTAITLDLLVVAVLALFTWLGWRKGLLLSLCGLLVTLAALAGAGVLADALDEPVARVVEPKLAAVIHEQFEQQYDSNPISDPLDALLELDSSYGWMTDALKEAGGTLEDVKNDTVEELTRNAAHLIAVQAVHHILFAAVFLILTALLTSALRALNLVAKLPVLGFFNNIGGGLLGFVKGVVVVTVAALVIQLFSYKLPEGTENTYIFRFFTYLPVLFLHS